MEQLIHSAPRLSEEEYLRLEEAAKARHEFRDGQVIDMAGGTEQHATIAANLVSELRARLRGKPCKAYGSDLRLRIAISGDYVYPDAMVICGEPEFHIPQSRSTVLNPQLVIEVISPSTEADDRGRKFTLYRGLSSLREYLLVSQQQPEVETYFRQADGIWAIGPRYATLERAVAMGSLQIEIPITEIYAGVEFVPPPPPAAPVE